MTDQPKPTPQDEDVEAHAGKFRFGPEQAPADVEAHRFKWGRDEEAPTEKPTGTEPAIDDADDDVEGHAPRRLP